MIHTGKKKEQPPIICRSVVEINGKLWDLDEMNDDQLEFFSAHFYKNDIEGCNPGVKVELPERYYDHQEIERIFPKKI